MAQTGDVVSQALRSHSATWDKAMDKYNYYLSGEEARYSPSENRIYVVDSNLEKYAGNPRYPQEMLTDVPDQLWNSSPMRESPSDEACIPRNRPVMPGVKIIAMLIFNFRRQPHSHVFSEVDHVAASSLKSSASHFCRNPSFLPIIVNPSNTHATRYGRHRAALCDSHLA